MDSAPHARGLGSWTVALVAATAALRALGDGPLATPGLSDLAAIGTLAGPDPIILAIALVRAAALALAAYLLAVTLLAWVLQHRRAPALVRMARHLLVPGARHLLPATVVLCLLAPSAGATTAPRAPTPETEVADHILPAPPGVLGPTALPHAGRSTGASSPAEWTVTAGDHLWSIAAAVLAAELGGPPGEAVIAPYWRRLIEANRDRLADRDDPDLLFPGQRLRLPPP
jgi:nucleoid-associated protein YgaU